MEKKVEQILHLACKKHNLQNIGVKSNKLAISYNLKNQ